MIKKLSVLFFFSLYALFTMSLSGSEDSAQTVRKSVLFVGDRVVGRTSFFDSLKGENFRERTPSSLDIDHYPLETNDPSSEVREKIFLKSVQTDFLHVFFEADAYVLCYDLRSPQSLLFSLDWHNLKGISKKVILLGLRVDEVEDPELKKKYVDQILKEKYPDFHYSHHFIFSNKTRKGLEEIKEAIRGLF